MADTKPAAEAASNNPADVVEVESTNDVQTTSADSAGATKAEAADVKSEDISANDQKPPTDAVKNEESSAVKADKKAMNGDEKEKRSGDREHRNGGKYERDNRRNGDRYNRKKSRHNEFADLPETDDPVEIRQQVEFYFSIQNLSQDEHMFLEMAGPENRPVSIKHLHTFKRMRRFQPYSAVVAALRDSESLVVVEDGEFSGTGNEGIQRKEPISVPQRDQDEKYKPSTAELFQRVFRQSRNALDASIYAKGFGDEEQAGQIALEKFLKPYGAVMVRKRRDEDEKWKGSVFVEFDSNDSQQQFLALDPKPKFNGNDLTIMSKKEYSEMKCKEKGITPAWEQEPGAGEGRYRGRGNDRRGGRGGRGRGGGRGRYNDRSNRHDDRGRRDRDRSRSPYERRRQRDRSDSRDSRDSRDWNGRRDKFQKSGDFKHGRRGKDQGRDSKPSDPNNKWGILKDEDGVPIVQDTRGDDSAPAKSNKRRVDDSDREDGPKKNKVEQSNKRKANDDREDSPKRSKIEIKEDA